MDIFCSVVRATEAAGAQRCSRTPGCLLGVAHHRTHSHHHTADWACSYLQPDPEACNVHVCFLLSPTVRGRIRSQREAEPATCDWREWEGFSVFSLVWNIGRKQCTQPRRPLNKAKTTISQSPLLLSLNVQRSSGAQTPTDRRRTAAVTPQRSQQKVSSLSSPPPFISIIYCLESGSTGFGASGKRNKVISEGWVALFCRVKVGAASSLFGFVCSLLHVQCVRSINHATRDAWL